jgi:UDP-N-acetylglucosamine--N-acetylmuramyl-(pentapeptide) pyrophosphoryl-undecaprenol N-acetylglucosamine transferase
MMTSKKIFVVGGGTGGHLFPAVAVGQELVRRGHEVHLITDDRCVKYLDTRHSRIFSRKNIWNPESLGQDSESRVVARDDTIHIINSSGFKSGLIAKILLFFKVIASLIKTCILFLKEKPDLIITFGGYAAFAPLLCANILGVPTVIHEQNCFFGKVNKWFAKRAEAILLAFQDTKNIPLGNDNKIIISGNPVREEISAIMSKKNFKTNPFKVVIIGGSQGAKVFSDLVPKAIEITVQRNRMVDLEVAQQAKLEDIDRIKAIYKACGVKCDISDFFHNIQEVLSSAHLVIARSGASTIAELIALTQPAFFVPYPFAAENHQDFNADVIEKNGGGWWVDQKNVTAEIIANKIIEAYEDRSVLVYASKNLQKLKMDAVNIIANVAEKIIASLKK